MPNEIVNYALIENEGRRKVSYQKRFKSILKKSEELKILCGVEVAVVIYGSYRSEANIFPNHDGVCNTFLKFKQLPMSDRLNYMMTRDEFTKQLIKKTKRNLQKVRKENKVRKMINEMYEILYGKNVSVDMHPYDHNDLSCVIKQNLKQVQELLKRMAGEEGSTSDAPRPFVDPMVTDSTNSQGTWDSSPILFSQLFPPVVLDFPSMDTSPTGVSTPMNNYHNISNDSSDPPLSEMFNWNNDVMTLLDQSFFDNINVQDP